MENRAQTVEATQTWSFQREPRHHHGLQRVIAGSVEEKILRMGTVHIRKGLIRHLVITDMEDLLDAHQELTAAEEMCPAL